MKGIRIEQDYGKYSEEDHRTWSLLVNRYMEFNYHHVSREYQKGFRLLDLEWDRIAKIGELSDRLERLSGWVLVPVDGLIPTRDFFYMLINKEYPVTTRIRKACDLDFSEQPDIFHDICGHVPLLVNEKFYRFLTELSTIALRYVNSERAIECLGRLYWYTYEMGIILEEGIMKPYGGAILTSLAEINNVTDTRIPKNRFDLGEVFCSPYNPFRLQDRYFVIQSFDELFNCMGDIESRLVDNLFPLKKPEAMKNYYITNRVRRDLKNVIGFLNDVQFRFPNAISLVAGQPDEELFGVDEKLSRIREFAVHRAEELGISGDRALNSLGQYNKTKGMINEIVANHLRVDENIDVCGDDIIVTVGAQEAFAIIVSTLLNAEREVILIEDPSYIGVSGFATVFGYPIAGVRMTKEGIDLAALEETIINHIERGISVKLVYVIPDHQNPTGCSMPVGNRLRLLDLSLRYNFLIIEDGVYNSFTYIGKKTPAIKSMDRYHRVIYVGSFSKSLFPGLRVGYLIANQRLLDADGHTVVLSDELAKVKAQITNNTSSISQAIVGGTLLASNYSLQSVNQRKYDSYKEKRNKIVACLKKYIGDFDADWAKDISWNEPEGGFFVQLRLPFNISEQDVIDCAENYNVIFCPMEYFYLNGGGENEIRLTFSNLRLSEIEFGIARLAAFLKSKSTVNKPLKSYHYDRLH